MKILKKIFGIFFSVLLWGILAVSALVMVVMVASKASGKQPTFFGYGMYQIVSGSMQPEIMVGDVVIGKKVDTSSIKVGDNIIFSYGKIIVTHKVIGVNTDGSFTTHGIANPTGSNEQVLAKDVLACQVFKIPKLGYALNFLRSPFGFIMIIALPLGGLVIYQTINLTKRLKEYAAPLSNSVPIIEEINALKHRLATQDLLATNPNLPQDLPQKDNSSPNKDSIVQEQPLNTKETIVEDLPLTTKETIVEEQPLTTKETIVQ